MTEQELINALLEATPDRINEPKKYMDLANFKYRVNAGKRIIPKTLIRLAETHLGKTLTLNITFVEVQK